MNPFQKLLQSIGASGIKRASGLIDDVVRPPASLKPTSVPTAFPFDDPLALLKGQARYVQRQVQGGIGQAIGQVGNLYKKIPTAVNPFATRTPTTLLGKAGKLVNPFNPFTAATIAAGAVLDATIPDNTRRNNEYYNLGLLGLPIPSLPGKIAALGLLGTTVNAFDEDAFIRQSNAALRVGKNYTVNGIQYDYKTGRAINPPSDTFVPDRSAAPPDNSGFIAIDNNTNNRRPENFTSPRNTEAERRAYLSELSSVAQQTTQNPLLNQYYALRKPDPRAAEDLGMQMFALANPELAKKVTPGQAGYDVIQRVYPQAATAETLPPPVDPTGLTEEERQAIANQMFYNQY